MAHIRSLIFATIGALGIVASYFIETALNISRDVGNFLAGAIEFRPDANQSINLDVAACDLVDHRQPGIASRLANFIKRAMNHDDFAAGRFDPGRMPA